MNASGFVIIKWTSSGRVVTLRRASTMGGPMVRFGTKWPSMTSTCTRSAPACSTAAISSAKCAKSDDRMEGAIRTLGIGTPPGNQRSTIERSEEHTSELQSRLHLVCRLLLEKKKKKKKLTTTKSA